MKNSHENTFQNRNKKPNLPNKKLRNNVIQHSVVSYASVPSDLSLFKIELIPH